MSEKRIFVGAQQRAQLPDPLRLGGGGEDADGPVMLLFFGKHEHETDFSLDVDRYLNHSGYAQRYGIKTHRLRRPCRGILPDNGGYDVAGEKQAASEMLHVAEGLAPIVTLDLHHGVSQPLPQDRLRFSSDDWAMHPRIFPYAKEDLHTYSRIFGPDYVWAPLSKVRGHDAVERAYEPLRRYHHAAIEAMPVGGLGEHGLVQGGERYWDAIKDTADWLAKVSADFMGQRQLRRV
jgi:hypothetical protein